MGLISLSISDFSIGNVQSHHIYVFCTSSLAPYLEGPIHLTEHILSGGLSTRIFFCVSLSFLSPWLDQLSFRYQMVYAIYVEIIIPIPLHIPYSMLYVIYDLEGSNDVNPQVRNLFHVGKIYLPFCLVH